MRALVLHGPGDYRVEDDWPDPEPQPGWARVRVRYAGVCGSDLPRFARTGSYRHPMILGHEFSGEVETPAPDSARSQQGDRVAVLPIIPCGACEGCRRWGPFHCRAYQFLGSRNDGGFAELALVPEANLLSLPEDLDLRLGALVEPLAVGLHTVRRARVRAGERAAVFGAGPIGLFAAAWLHVFGAQTTVIDPREDRRALARAVGFETVFAPDDEVLQEAGPFAHAIEAAGAAAALARAVDLVCDCAAITVIGRDPGDTVLAHETWERLLRKELTVRGCWGYDLREDTETLRGFLARAPIALEALITHEVPLDEAEETIDRMIDGTLAYGKVLIRL